MSYDLTFLRLDEGEDADMAYRKYAEDQEGAAVDLDAWRTRHLPDTVRADMRLVADALKSWRPALQEFQPKIPLPWIELTDDHLMVQFSVDERAVSTTFPYFGDHPEEMIDCVFGGLAAINTVARYVAYDPQLGRTVTAADLKEMTGMYRRIDRVFPEVRASRKPWWKFW